MRYIIFIFITFISFLASANAQLSNIPGAFVDVGYGARPMGMGGAFTAVSDDPNAAYWNPAGLLKVPNPGVSLMYTKQMNLIPYYYSTFQMYLSADQAIGAMLMYNGDDLYNEFSFIGSYAYHAGKYLIDPFKELYVGASLQYRHAGYGNNPDGGIGQISGSANGYGLNVGALWEISKVYTLAIVWKDFLDDMNWSSQSEELNYSNSYSEDIPSVLTIGAAIKPDNNSTIGIDYQLSMRADTYDRIALGYEKEFFSFIIPRFGISQNLFAPKEEQNRHISVGLGIEPEFAKTSIGIAFNFAYQFTDINPTLRFGADLDWGKKYKIPLPPRGAIVARPEEVKLGEPIELKWLVRGASYIEIEPGIGRVDSSGSMKLIPDNSTIYKLKAIGSGGNLNYTTQVIVQKFAYPPTAVFTATPQEVNEGETVLLKWDVKDAKTVTIVGIGEVSSSGIKEVKPTLASQYYILKARGDGGEVAQVVAVKVRKP